jgi:hypothetical protein
VLNKLSPAFAAPSKEAQVMLTFEFAALFALAALLAAGTLVVSLRDIWPLAKQLKAELAACPDKLELRYAITETVVRWDDGTVVPLKARQARLAPPPAMRAAA